MFAKGLNRWPWNRKTKATRYKSAPVYAKDNALGLMLVCVSIKYTCSLLLTPPRGSSVRLRWSTRETLPRAIKRLPEPSKWSDGPWCYPQKKSPFTSFTSFLYSLIYFPVPQGSSIIALNLTSWVVNLTAILLSLSLPLSPSLSLSLSLPPASSLQYSHVSLASHI